MFPEPDRDDLKVAKITFSTSATPRPSCFLTPPAPLYSPWGPNNENEVDVQQEAEDISHSIRQIQRFAVIVHIKRYTNYLSRLLQEFALYRPE